MTDIKSELTQQEMKSLIKKILKRFSLILIVLGLLILVPAGTFNFWQVYVYLAVLVIPMIFVLFYFLKKDPLFLERRTRAKEKEKTQKIIQIVFSVIFLSGFVIPGLDKRFGWSDIPISIVLITDLIIGRYTYILEFWLFQ